MVYTIVYKYVEIYMIYISREIFLVEKERNMISNRIVEILGLPNTCRDRSSEAITGGDSAYSHVVSCGD